MRIALTMAVLIGASPAAAYDLAPGVDPVVLEIVSTCSDAVALQSVPTEAGWRASGPTAREAPLAQSDTHYADKDIDGVGRLHLSLQASIVNGDLISHCDVTISAPGRTLPIADFGKSDGLDRAGDDNKSVWFSSDNKMMITAMSRANPDFFLFSMAVIADARR